MATQEDQSKTIATGTVDGLLAFCDYLAKSGYMSAAATTPWKSAARQVFAAVKGDGYGALDLREIDLDELIGQFETLERGNYKVESIQAYESRVRKAVEAYLAFLKDGRTPQQRRGARRRAERADRPAEGTPPPARPEGRAAAASPVADLVDYTFPLRSGTLVYVRVPRQLEKADAERLAAFVQMLGVEPPVELPPGPDGDREEQ